MLCHTAKLLLLLVSSRIETQPPYVVVRTVLLRQRGWLMSFHSNLAKSVEFATLSTGIPSPPALIGQQILCYATVCIARFSAVVPQKKFLQSRSKMHRVCFGTSTACMVQVGRAMSVDFNKIKRAALDKDFNFQPVSLWEILSIRCWNSLGGRLWNKGTPKIHAKIRCRRNLEFQADRVTQVFKGIGRKPNLRFSPIDSLTRNSAEIS